MPSDSSLKAFLSSLSPEDVATLFAGLRNTLPIGMGVYSPELNAGEAEIVGKRRMERDAARAREMEIMAQLLPQMMARRQAMATPGGEPDIFVPTRPRIMKESPFMFTQPQMSRAPQQYAKGGKVLGKTLDEMQAELMSKEGLSRRSLFGLKPQYPVAVKNEPLSKVEQEVKRAETAARKEGQAPSVTASRVDVDPGTGRKKSVMESVTETPVSRRTVLKTAGSQAMQSMLPMGGIAKALDVPAAVSPAGAIAQAARAVPAVPVLTSPFAIAAKMLREGKPVEDIASAVGMHHDDFGFDYMMSKLEDPSQYLRSDLPTLKTPSETLNEILHLEDRIPAIGSSKWSSFAMRPELRQLKHADPKAYKRMLEAARDVSMASGETAVDLGVSPEIVKQYMRGKIPFAKLPEDYQAEIDAINSGWGSSRGAGWGRID